MKINDPEIVGERELNKDVEGLGNGRWSHVVDLET